MCVYIYKHIYIYIHIYIAMTGNQYIRSFDSAQFRYLYRNACSNIVCRVQGLGCSSVISIPTRAPTLYIHIFSKVPSVIYVYICLYVYI
jgi:hypothetical protein